MPPSAAPSDRTRARRQPSRGAYDRTTIDAILDAGLVAHVAFVDDGQPFAIPTLHARVGDELLLHGSSASRALRAMSAGRPLCATVTLVDGLVLARSVFNHSANYRSVVVLGEAREIVDGEEKLAALRALTERLIPGRWDAVRAPDAQELKATTIVALPIGEASAKLRGGPPGDDGTPDAELDVWAGVIPLRVEAGAPIPAPGLRAGIEMPEAVRRYARPGLTDTAAAPSREPGAHTAARRPACATLHGERVRLEPLDPARHGADLFEAAQGEHADPRLWDFMGYGPFADAETLAAWAEEVAAGEDPLFLAVVDRATGRAGGVVSFLRVEPAHGAIEIGHIWFGAALQRTPHATEAIFLLARHAFDDLGNRRLEWKCDALNARSRRAAERFGFTYEGTFRQHMVVKGRNRDTAWFAMLDHEWPRIRAAFEAWLAPGNFDDAGRQREALRT